MPRFTYGENIITLPHTAATLYDEGLADDVARAARTSAIIIVTPGEEAEAPTLPNIHRKLYLTFDDIEEGERVSYGGRALKAISPIQARTAAAFADVSEELVVTCAGGISRSAGIAAGILAATGGDDSIVFRMKCPNMTCYRKVIDAMLRV